MTKLEMLKIEIERLESMIEFLEKQNGKGNNNYMVYSHSKRLNLLKAEYEELASA